MNHLGARSRAPPPPGRPGFDAGQAKGRPWPRHPSLGIAALLILAAVLASAIATQGAPAVRQDVLMAPTAATPALLLQAGDAGSTALGASSTSAVTTGLVPDAGGVDALGLYAGPTSWTVRVRIVEVAGVDALESVSVSLIGATTATLAVDPGSTYPATSAAVDLPAFDTLALAISTAEACMGCTLTLEFRATPGDDPAALLVYRATLATA